MALCTRSPLLVRFMGQIREARTAYALFYFVFFSFQAVVLGFFPLHCQSLGFSDFQIAAVASLENIASLSGPLTFSFLLTRLARPVRALTLSALVSALAFLPLVWAVRFPVVFVLYLCCLFFNRGVMSLVNTWAVRDSVAGTIDFGRVRLWGSVGFIAFMMLLGVLVDRFGISAVVSISAVVLFVNALSVLLVPERSVAAAKSTIGDQARTLRQTLQNRTLLFYVASVATLWAAHGAFFTYFSIHLKSLGWSGTEISATWTVGVVAEIVVFIFFARLENLLGVRRIFILSIAVMVLRCVLVMLFHEPAVIVFSQVLHAFSFGSFYISSLRLCHELFPDSIREHGQALVVAMGSGLGALIGRLIGGVVATFFALSWGYGPVFLLAGGFAALAVWLSSMLGSGDSVGVERGEMFVGAGK